MDRQTTTEKEGRTHNSGLAKVAVQCSADTFVVNQSLFSASIPIVFGMVKIATFAKPQTVRHHHFETVTMLNIDRQIFADNLILTQAYCDIQLKNDIKDNAKVFRSYNPVYGDKKLFSFETEHFGFEIKPNLNHCTLAKWLLDPTDTESIVDNLYEEQNKHKKQFVSLPETDKTYSGRILVAQIDYTVIDGASEVQSLGLVDTYDIPPIDTWFYKTSTQESRLLFAWIPSEFVYYANEAVEVNCVDCINWADIWFPQEFEKYLDIHNQLTTTW